MFTVWCKKCKGLYIRLNFFEDAKASSFVIINKKETAHHQKRDSPHYSENSTIKGTVSFLVIFSNECSNLKKYPKKTNINISILLDIRGIKYYNKIV